MTTKSLAWGAAVVALMLAACAMKPVNTRALHIEPTLPLVATKIPRPLYVVLDPTQVPDEYTIPARTTKEIRILEIREFVRRDLRDALSSMFAAVTVVGLDDVAPPDAMIAQVQIQRFAAEIDQVTSGDVIAGRVYGQMGWSFAIRKIDEPEFRFSYAETVTGTFPLVRVDQTAEMMESTYRIALEQLMARLSDREVMARLSE
ncbi:MAG: hypothetical protein IPL61_06950 [Myxococcales bacterium]|nr:hypothetical protein [Myxococcales bacterium]